MKTALALGASLLNSSMQLSPAPAPCDREVMQRFMRVYYAP